MDRDGRGCGKEDIWEKRREDKKMGQLDSTEFCHIMHVCMWAKFDFCKTNKATTHLLIDEQNDILFIEKSQDRRTQQRWEVEE